MPKTEIKTLTETQLALLDKVEKVLAGLELPYAIKMPDGTLRGDITAVTKMARVFKHGEVKAYVKPFLENIQVGQSVVIPADKYGVGRVQSSACNVMTDIHGPDMYSTKRLPDGSGVEVIFDCGL